MKGDAIVSKRNRKMNMVLIEMEGRRDYLSVIKYCLQFVTYSVYSYFRKDTEALG